MAEQVKLVPEAIGLEERKAIERSFALVRKATPQMRALAERYGGDVSFSFDSNGRSVWVMALLGKDAPPIAPSRRRENAAPPQGERDLARGASVRAIGFVSVFMN